MNQGEPPNLRMMEGTAACGNCRHYTLPGKYDPARSREEGGRKLSCTAFGNVRTEAYEVCDSHVRRRS